MKIPELSARDILLTCCFSWSFMAINRGQSFPQKEVVWLSPVF